MKYLWNAKSYAATNLEDMLNLEMTPMTALDICLSFGLSKPRLPSSDMFWSLRHDIWQKVLIVLSSC